MAEIGQLIEWTTSELMLCKERGNETLQESGLLLDFILYFAP